jgi:hypothetical protein
VSVSFGRTVTVVCRIKQFVLVVCVCVYMRAVITHTQSIRRRKHMLAVRFQCLVGRTKQVIL